MFMFLVYEKTNDIVNKFKMVLIEGTGSRQKRSGTSQTTIGHIENRNSYLSPDTQL